MLAKHKASGTLSAVKIINKKNLKESGGSQYYHEASVMAPCKHPNIVKFIESFETKDEVYISTQFQKGGDLIRHINTHWGGNNLPEKAVKSLAFGIAKGL
jgi:serine/threonine protein kinase